MTTLPRGRLDPKLRHFSIAHDKAYILPALRAALATQPSDCRLLATPWSAPAWMKGNDSLDNVGERGTAPWLRVWALGGVHRQVPAGLRSSGCADPGADPRQRARQPDALSGDEHVVGQHRDLDQPVPGARARARRACTRSSTAADYGWGTPSAAQAAISGPAAPDLSGIAWHCYFGSPSVMSSLHTRVPGSTRSSTSARPGSARSPSLRS